MRGSRWKMLVCSMCRASLVGMQDIAGTPDGDCPAGTIDYARVSLESLADTRTTIEEFHTWQFAARSCGTSWAIPRQARRDAGALEAASP